MMFCGVRGCKKESYPGCGLVFHKLPSDDDIRQKWIDVVPGSLKKYSVVCGLHFTLNDYITPARRRLKPNAVPSIFPKLKSESSSYNDPKTTEKLKENDDSENEDGSESDDGSENDDDDKSPASGPPYFPVIMPVIPADYERQKLSNKAKQMMIKLDHKNAQMKYLRKLNSRMRNKIGILKKIIINMSNMPLEVDTEIARNRNNNILLRKKAVYLKKLLREQKIKNMVLDSKEVGVSTEC